MILVTGRDPYKENSGLNGEYHLSGICEGRPYYQQLENENTLRYWPAEDRWLIDLENGIHGGDVANAYADARGAEHPGCTDLLWYVWETSRGRHVADEDVVAAVVDLPTPDWSKLDFHGEARGGA